MTLGHHLMAYYEMIGRDRSRFADARARMKAWRASTPRDKHGAHEYHPEEYGLDVAKLRDRFRFYSDRFEVPAA